MKRIEPQQIGDIIQDVFERAGQKDNADRYRALVNWGNIVGGGINSITTRRYVTEQGVMHVYISSAAVKQDLMFQRTRLVEELNKFAGVPGAITDLVIH
ncbi:MAG: DUF721 domain-containing protein [Bacteroides sp.]|nr:DUF721 domain-containing protein [Bacteroides sp.]MCM1379430.1 DUF721 domain-containing protein [Bacteroides sp.]MCM1445290.1 DUF721 domain-containing protein [Prevotella sp.]